REHPVHELVRLRHVARTAGYHGDPGIGVDEQTAEPGFVRGIYGSTERHRCQCRMRTVAHQVQAARWATLLSVPKYLYAERKHFEAVPRVTERKHSEADATSRRGEGDVEPQLHRDAGCGKERGDRGGDRYACNPASPPIAPRRGEQLSKGLVAPHRTTPSVPTSRPLDCRPAPPPRQESGPSHPRLAGHSGRAGWHLQRACPKPMRLHAEGPRH